MSAERETWVCLGCGTSRSADSVRAFLLLGWELLSLRRDGGRRAVLCPDCRARRTSAA